MNDKLKALHGKKLKTAIRSKHDKSDFWFKVMQSKKPTQNHESHTHTPAAGLGSTAPPSQRTDLRLGLVSAELRPSVILPQLRIKADTASLMTIDDAERSLAHRHDGWWMLS